MRLLCDIQELISDLTRRAKACNELAAEQSPGNSTEATRLRNKGAGYSHSAELVTDWGNRNNLFIESDARSAVDVLRPGIPREILREVHDDWSAFDGWRWRSSQLTEEAFMDRTAHDLPVRDAYSKGGWRPIGATWHVIECKAAALIGKRDAEAGTPRRGWFDVLALMRNGIIIPSGDNDISTQTIGQAYLDAYAKAQVALDDSQ